MSNTYRKIPGVVLVLLIVFLSNYISDLLRPIFVIEGITISILLGMLTVNLFRLPESTKPGIQFSLKKILKYGIVLLGFKLQFDTVMTLGPSVLGVVVLFVPVVILLAYLVSKYMKLDNKLGVLIGVGTGICGASAVVAMAPVIDAKEEDGIIAVSVVSLLGSVGVLVYMLLQSVFNIDATLYGLWSGLSLHGVAHAVAAAFAGGEVAGEVGVLVKMARVLMLIPVSIVLSYMFGGKSKKINVPVYIVLFVVMAIINTVFTIPEGLLNVLKETSSLFIMMAMTAMGLSVKFIDLKQSGIKALVVGTVLFLVTSTIAFIVMSLVV